MNNRASALRTRGEECRHASKRFVAPARTNAYPRCCAPVRGVNVLPLFLPSSAVRLPCVWCVPCLELCWAVLCCAVPRPAKRRERKAANRERTAGQSRAEERKEGGQGATREEGRSKDRTRERGWQCMGSTDRGARNSNSGSRLPPQRSSTAASKAMRRPRNEAKGPSLDATDAAHVPRSCVCWLFCCAGFGVPPPPVRVAAMWRKARTRMRGHDSCAYAADRSWATRLQFVHTFVSLHLRSAAAFLPSPFRTLHIYRLARGPLLVLHRHTSFPFLLA
jgi:hypothetical protein